MLKEIHLAGSVRKPFSSCCDGFADVSAVELGKASVERSGVKPEDVEELLVGKHPQRRPSKRRAPDRDRGAETSSSLLPQLSFHPFPEKIMARVVAPFIEVIAHGFFAGTKEDRD